MAYRPDQHQNPTQQNPPFDQEEYIYDEHDKYNDINNLDYYDNTYDNHSYIDNSDHIPSTGVGSEEDIRTASAGVASDNRDDDGDEPRYKLSKPRDILDAHPNSVALYLGELGRGDKGESGKSESGKSESGKSEITGKQKSPRNPRSALHPSATSPINPIARTRGDGEGDGGEETRERYGRDDISVERGPLDERERGRGDDDGDTEGPAGGGDGDESGDESDESDGSGDNLTDDIIEERRIRKLVEEQKKESIQRGRGRPKKGSPPIPPRVKRPRGRPRNLYPTLKLSKYEGTDQIKGRPAGSGENYSLENLEFRDMLTERINAHVNKEVDTFITTTFEAIVNKMEFSSLGDLRINIIIPPEESDQAVILRKVMLHTLSFTVTPKFFDTEIVTI